MNSIIFDGSIGGDKLPPFKPIINPIQREEVSNILNIDAQLIVALHLHLYNVNEADDVDIVIEAGKTYEVKYITEEGVKTATGVLKTLEPDKYPAEPMRLINSSNLGNFDNTHIALDCSTVGNSYVARIPILTIRDIKEIKEEVIEPVEPTPDTEETVTPDTNVELTE